MTITSPDVRRAVTTADLRRMTTVPPAGDFDTSPPSLLDDYNRPLLPKLEVTGGRYTPANAASRVERLAAEGTPPPVPPERVERAPMTPLQKARRSWGASVEAEMAAMRGDEPRMLTGLPLFPDFMSPAAVSLAGGLDGPSGPRRVPVSIVPPEPEVDVADDDEEVEVDTDDDE